MKINILGGMFLPKIWMKQNLRDSSKNTKKFHAPLGPKDAYISNLNIRYFRYSGLFKDFLNRDFGARGWVFGTKMKILNMESIRQGYPGSTPGEWNISDMAILRWVTLKNLQIDFWITFKRGFSLERPGS